VLVAVSERRYSRSTVLITTPARSAYVQQHTDTPTHTSSPAHSRASGSTQLTWATSRWSQWSAFQESRGVNLFKAKFIIVRTSDWCLVSNYIAQLQLVQSRHWLGGRSVVYWPRNRTPHDSEKGSLFEKKQMIIFLPKSLTNGQRTRKNQNSLRRDDRASSSRGRKTVTRQRLQGSFVLCLCFPFHFQWHILMFLLRTRRQRSKVIRKATPGDLSISTTRQVCSRFLSGGLCRSSVDPTSRAHCGLLLPLLQTHSWHVLCAWLNPPPDSLQPPPQPAASPRGPPVEILRRRRLSATVGVKVVRKRHNAL